ncbi:multiple epidermal growth factor-like domains protein 11 isoform X1 [Haliotis asinina]
MEPFCPVWRHQVFFVVVVFCMVPSVIGSSTCPSCNSRNVTCAGGVCVPRCVNVTSSGECLMCRDFHFHGVQCEHICPDTCLNSRCQMDNSRVVCIEGCVTGKRGDNCGVDCPPSCTHCLGNECIGPCLNPGYFGPKCETTCPENCNTGCNKTTGVCNTCSGGYMGKSCTDVCPSGCRDGCDQNTGVCHSCKPWYSGDHCDKCQSGYRGKYCNINCPALCTACERHGNKCIGQCLNIWNYGEYCNHSCPPNCRELCGKLAGECDSCVPGYRGKFCNISCPVNCTECNDLADDCVEPCTDRRSYGKACKLDCPVNCVGGCYRLTGDCINCKPGYRGRYCKLRCEDGACSQGDHDPRLATKVVGGVLGVVVLLGVTAAVSVLMKRYRCCKSQVPVSCRTDTTRRCNCGDYWTHRYWEINEQDVNSDQRVEQLPRPNDRSSCSAATGARTAGRTAESQREQHESSSIEEQNVNPVLGTSNTETYHGSETGAGFDMPALFCEARPISEYYDDDNDDGLFPFTDFSVVNPGLDLRLASARSDTDIDYCQMSLDTQSLIKKTDSVLFIEKNCDLSNVNVKYLTPKSQT